MTERVFLSLRKAVIKRPGMYFGDEGAERLQQLIDELVSNAVDQYLRGQCRRLDVRLDDDGWIEVVDDGPGLPFDREGPVPGESLATHYLLHAHSTATADGAAPHVHVHQCNGGGIALVNAVCSTLVCRSWRETMQWEQRFREGQPEAPPQVHEQGAGRGTSFRMRPDPAIFGSSPVDASLVRASLWRTAHLFAGLIVGCGRETFVAPNGLADLVRVMHEPTAIQIHAWRDRPVFRRSARFGDYAVDAAAYGFAQTPQHRCRWHSWVNGRSTPLHGSHVDGFARALQACGWQPAIGMLHVIAHDPRYAGPTRDRYSSGAAEIAIEEALAAPLNRFCAEQGLK